jgi:hypothetical protein
MKRLLLKQMSDGRTVLSGAGAGRALLAKLIAQTEPTARSEVVFLDFSGIEIATSSFLRESVIGFRDYARNSLQNVYPVVANASDSVSEELEFFVRNRGDAVWSCTLNDAGEISSPEVLGELDPVQRATFEAVIKCGAATASELAAREPNSGVGLTAWNNRLSWLSTKGLLVEKRSGKTKSFSPTLETS